MGLGPLALALTLELATRAMECGGKVAADDTALDIPELQNALGRLEIQSGVDAYALPPQSIWALETLTRGRDSSF